MKSRKREALELSLSKVCEKGKIETLFGAAKFPPSWLKNII